MSTTTARISQLNLVMVPVEDQDRSIEFYVERLGFEKRTDVPFGGDYRWVEVYPPSGTAGIALCPPRPGEPFQARDTGISLSTDDAEAVHADLRSQGVDVDEAIMRMGEPIPPMFWLRDPDGHTLMIVELP